MRAIRPSTLDEWTNYDDGIGVVRRVLRARVVVVGWVAGLRFIGARRRKQGRGLHGVDRPHFAKRGLAAARFAGRGVAAKVGTVIGSGSGVGAGELSTVTRGNRCAVGWLDARKFGAAVLLLEATV